MENLESENVSLEFQVQSLIKEQENNVKQNTYAYVDVRAQNQDLLTTISELRAKLKNVENGLSATSSVRTPSNMDSLFKNSVVSNTKNSSKKVEVSDRTNKKPNVVSKNVALNTFVTNEEIKNALIAKNVLCVSCAKMKRISEKRTKNQAKTDKTEHGMEKREKTKSNRSQSPEKSKVNTDAETK
ncbi:hypothetical protein Tco_0461717 [Tanacetum coccineum]